MLRKFRLTYELYGQVSAYLMKQVYKVRQGL